jgi:hypothetical protein
MTPTPAPLRVVGLQVENFKRIQAIQIIPKGDLVQITGRNAQGKTSAIDALWVTLGGGKLIPGKPIREGSKECRIRVALGNTEAEIIATRTFKTKGTETVSELTLESAEGARFKGPQGMLDAMMGSITFDPLAFTRMDKRRQAEELRAIAKIEVDLDRLDGLNLRDFETRANLNKQAAQARAAGEAIPMQTPPAPVDLSTLLARMEGITAQTVARGNAEREQDKRRRQLDDQSIRWSDLGDAIAQKERELDAMRQERAAVKAWVDQEAVAIMQMEPLPEVEDATALREQIARAQEQNRQADLIAQQQAKRDEHLDRARELEGEAAGLTEAMEARKKVKAEAIAAAEMPVPGLGLQDGVVTYNGIPFDQASGAEQLKVSTAIAMAANPRIRVIRIADGSLLDDDSLAMLAEMAHEKDYQIWIEMVDSTGKVGVHIEDGMVKMDNQPNTEPTATKAETQGLDFGGESAAGAEAGVD